MLGLRLFNKRKCFFPKDRAGRLKKVMEAHNSIAGDDAVRDRETLNLLVDLIDDEEDPFMLDSYVLYYIGFYKPFESHNVETAKALADGILADGGWAIPQDQTSFERLVEACSKDHTIDSIADWQKTVAYRI